jgi:hypothetical protein
VQSRSFSYTCDAEYSLRRAGVFTGVSMLLKRSVIPPRHRLILERNPSEIFFPATVPAAIARLPADAEKENASERQDSNGFTQSKTVLTGMIKISNRQFIVFIL